MQKKSWQDNKIETEVKFVIPNQETFAELQQLSTLADFQLQSLGGPKIITDRYLDTKQKLLFQAGYAARIRTAKQKQKQILTLKTLTPPDDTIHRRQEIEQEIESDYPGEWATGEAKTLLLSIIAEATLQSLFVIHQTRYKYNIQWQNQAILEFSLDTVSLQDVNQVDYFELEVELLSAGTETQLLRFVTLLQQEWPLQAESQSKFERAWLKLVACP